MSIDIDSICKGFCIMFHNEPINEHIYIYWFITCHDVFWDTGRENQCRTTHTQ